MRDGIPGAGEKAPGMLLSEWKVKSEEWSFFRSEEWR
jgi:hypothetical protein